MKHEKLTTPNTIAGRHLTGEMFDELEAYIERYPTLGRECGLFVNGGEGMTALPYLNPPDVVVLPAIQAIGVNGFPIVAGRGAEEEGVPPLDAAELPEGRHKIYACLAWTKSACGNLFEDPGADGGAPVRARASRRPTVLLEAGDRRFEHRDWIQVAVLDRIRTPLSMQTRLDGRFHPPVQDLRAYLHENPLQELSSRALEALKGRGGVAGAVGLDVELAILHNIAECATPLVAFVQAQRCVGLLRGMEDPLLRIDGQITQYRYDAESFSSFLADLRDALRQQIEPTLFPDLLRIDAIRYQRMSDTLREGETGWDWCPDDAQFGANGLAVYLPRAKPGTLPVIQYGQGDRGGDFRIAPPGREIEGHGAAVLMKELGYPVRRIFLTVNSQQDRHRLRQFFGDGYALYYY